MTTQEILSQLESMGLDSYRKTILKHGVQEPVYGVKIEELKKIAKKVKDGYKLSLELYDSGIYDAMYLAGLLAQPELMTKADLQHWAATANSQPLREYTVPWVASESKHGMELALEWIESADVGIACSGWATLGDMVAITDNALLDMKQLKKLMQRVQKTIEKSPNRVKYVMNGFIISVGCYVPELSELAKQTALEIGKVKIDVGDTACKIPWAPEYIEKVEKRNAIGKKRKSARCL